MTVEHGPIVGEWYHRIGEEQAFQVVAVDEADGSVEIQYFDGTVDELRLAQWHSGIAAREAPQDWTGPFDSIVRDDLGVTEVDMTPDDWHAPYAAVPLDGAAAADDGTLEADGGLLDRALIEPAPVTELLYARPIRGASRPHRSRSPG